jgi:hypothetical protein
MKLSIKQKIRLKRILELKSKPENNYLSNKEIITILGIPKKSFYRLLYLIGNTRQCQKEHKMINLTLDAEQKISKTTLECQNDQNISILTLGECTVIVQFDTELSKRTEIEQRLGGYMREKVINYQKGNMVPEAFEVSYNKKGNEKSSDYIVNIDYTKILMYSGSWTPSEVFNKNFPKENSKKEKVKKKNEVDDYGFEHFWKAYPKTKASKKKTLQAFKKVVKSPSDFQKVMDAVENQHVERELAEKCGAFYPIPCHPTTWLNQERWEVEINLEREFWENEARKRQSPHQQKRTKAQQFFKRLSEISDNASDDEVGF